MTLIFCDAQCRSGCVEVQGLMEADWSETEEATWSDGDDGSVEMNMERTKADVGDRGSEIR
jgi:hypothetical protein